MESQSKCSETENDIYYPTVNNLSVECQHVYISLKFNGSVANHNFLDIKFDSNNIGLIELFQFSIYNGKTEMIIKFEKQEDYQNFYEFIKHSDSIEPNSLPKNVYLLQTVESLEGFKTFLSERQIISQLQYARCLSTYIKVLSQFSHIIKYRTVLHHDAGSGLLSFVAAKLGAKRVYAIEPELISASKLKSSIDKYGFGTIVSVSNSIDIHELSEKPDVLLCDTMVYLLLNDDILKRFLIAKQYLSPNFFLFPNICDINVAGFTDYNLVKKYSINNYDSKNQTNLFTQPIYENIGKNKIVTNTELYSIIFDKIIDSDVNNITVPFNLLVDSKCMLDGLAIWFEFHLGESRDKHRLSTSTEETLCHGNQLLTFFTKPINAIEEETISGNINFILKNDGYHIGVKLDVDERKKPLDVEDEILCIEKMENLSLNESNTSSNADTKTEVNKLEFEAMNVDRDKCEEKETLVVSESESLTSENNFHIDKLLSCYTKQETSIAKKYVIVSAKLYENELKDLISNKQFNDEMLNQCKFNSLSYLKVNLHGISKDEKFSKYSQKLKKKIKLLTSTYQIANNLITAYDRKWIAKLESRDYITADNMLKFNKVSKACIANDLKNIKLADVMQFIQNRCDNLYRKYEAINNEIFDNYFQKAVIKPAEEIINSRLDNILKNGLFSGSDIKMIFQKLLEYLCNKIEYYLRLNKCLDIDEDNAVKLKRSIEYRFDREQYPKLQQTFKHCVQTLNKARKHSIIKYSKAMELYLEQQDLIEKTTFQQIHKKCRTIAIDFHNEQTSSIHNYFETNVYQRINTNNIASLMNEINAEKNKAEPRFSEKKLQLICLSVYYGQKQLISGYYNENVRLINENTENCIKDNSIAYLNGNVYFGFDNDIEYKTLRSDRLHTNWTTIQDELNESKVKTFSAIELTQYELKFSKYQTGIVSYNNCQLLSVEALVALQLLKTKVDAEEELKQNIANMLVTVPTYFGIREINMMRNIGERITINSMNYISEMNALSISFIFSRKMLSPNETKLVLLVILSDAIYEAAVCSFSHVSVEYHSYSRGKLSIPSTNTDILKTLYHSLIHSEESNEIINRELNVPINYLKQLQDAIISGYSCHKDRIIDMLSLSIPKTQIYRFNHNDFINGTVYYSHIIMNAIQFNFIELAKYSIDFRYDSTKTAPKLYELIEINQKLAKPKQFELKLPNNLFPLKISFFQNKACIEQFRIPEVVNSNSCEHFFVFYVSNEKLEILYTIDNNIKKSINDYRIKVEERNIIMRSEKRVLLDIFAKQFKSQINDRKQIILIKTMKKDIIDLCDAIKTEMDKSTTISRLKTRLTLDSLDKARIVMNSDLSKAIDFDNQIKSLKILLKSIKSSVELPK